MKKIMNAAGNPLETVPIVGDKSKTLYVIT